MIAVHVRERDAAEPAAEDVHNVEDPSGRAGNHGVDQRQAVVLTDQIAVHKTKAGKLNDFRSNFDLLSLSDLCIVSRAVIHGKRLPVRVPALQ